MNPTHKSGKAMYVQTPQSFPEMLEWWDERRFLLEERDDVRGARICEEVVSQLRRLLPKPEAPPDDQLRLTDPQS